MVLFLSSQNMKVGLPLDFSLLWKIYLLAPKCSIIEFVFPSGLVCHPLANFFGLNAWVNPTVGLVWQGKGVQFVWNQRSLTLLSSVAVSEDRSITRSSENFLLYPGRFCYRFKKTIFSLKLNVSPFLTGTFLNVLYLFWVTVYFRYWYTLEVWRRAENIIFPCLNWWSYSQHTWPRIFLSAEY